MDATGIPTFLSQFRKDLPLHLGHGITIDAMYEQDLVPGPFPVYVYPRTEIEDALLRFENLQHVLINMRNVYDSDEQDAWEAAVNAFPRLHEMKKLLLSLQEEEDPCW